MDRLIDYGLSVIGNTEQGTGIVHIHIIDIGYGYYIYIHIITGAWKVPVLPASRVMIDRSTQCNSALVVSR